MRIKIEPKYRGLTVREKQVKELLDEGLTTMQIARRLIMSVYAVEDTVHSIRAWESIQGSEKHDKN